MILYAFYGELCFSPNTSEVYLLALYFVNFVFELSFQLQLFLNVLLILEQPAPCALIYLSKPCKSSVFVTNNCCLQDNLHNLAPATIAFVLLEFKILIRSF